MLQVQNTGLAKKIHLYIFHLYLIPAIKDVRSQTFKKFKIHENYPSKDLITFNICSGVLSITETIVLSSVDLAS